MKGERRTVTKIFGGCLCQTHFMLSLSSPMSAPQRGCDSHEPQQVSGQEWQDLSKSREVKRPSVRAQAGSQD